MSRARRLGPRDGADVISTAASDLVVCTKHLSRLEPGTTTYASSPARRARTSPRGLEPRRYPPAGRLKTMGSGGQPVPVSTRLGRGAAHSVSGAHAVPSRVSSEHGSPINAGDSGTSGPDALARSTPHHQAEHRLRSGSVPSRVQLDGRLSRAPRARSGAQALAPLSVAPPTSAAGGHAPLFMEARERLASRDFGEGAR